MNPALIGMIGKVAPAVLNFAANIGSGYINSNTQESINRQSLAHADDAAELAYKRQVDLWQRQISYASPGNLMAMMAAAGINPNIAAGGSIGSIPSAPSVPQANSPSLGMSPMSLGTPLQDLLDIQRVRNETNQTDATVDNLLADTNLKIENLDAVKAQIRQIDAQILLSRQNAKYTEMLTEGERANVANSLIDLIKRKAFMDDEFDKLQRDYELSKQEFSYMCQSMALNLEGLKFQNAGVKLDNALKGQELKRVKTFNSFCGKLYEAQTDSAVAQAFIDAFDADMKEQFGTFEKFVSFAESLTGVTMPYINTFKKPGKKR